MKESIAGLFGGLRFASFRLRLGDFKISCPYIVLKQKHNAIPYIRHIHILLNLLLPKGNYSNRIIKISFKKRRDNEKISYESVDDKKIYLRLYLKIWQKKVSGSNGLIWYLSRMSLPSFSMHHEMNQFFLWLTALNSWISLSIHREFMNDYMDAHP